MIILACNYRECRKYCIKNKIPPKIDYFVNSYEKLLSLKRGTEIHLAGGYKENKAYKNKAFKDLAETKNFKFIGLLKK